MTDYDLVILCKKNDQKALVTLYTKYKPFLKKRFFMFKKRCPHSKIDLSDFFSEAYIWFVKTINYIDLDKIENPEKMCFLVIYRLFIQNMMEKMDRKFFRERSDVYLSDPIRLHQNKASTPFCFEDIVSQEQQTALSTEKKALENMFSNYFTSNLSLEENVIVTNLKKQSLLPKILIIKTIAKELNVSRQRIYQIISKTRERFLTEKEKFL